MSDAYIRRIYQLFHRVMAGVNDDGLLPVHMMLEGNEHLIWGWEHSWSIHRRTGGTRCGPGGGEIAGELDALQPG